MDDNIRLARVFMRKQDSRDDAEEIRGYLPGNYEVIAVTSEHVVIAGRDDHGWTLDSYVIPRLGSALYHCEEIHLGAALPDTGENP